jgi:hypothetical protein
MCTHDHLQSKCHLNHYDQDPIGKRIYIDHSLLCWCGEHTKCSNVRCKCICHSEHCNGCEMITELSDPNGTIRE